MERLRKALGLLEAHRDDDLYLSMRDSVLLSLMGDQLYLDIEELQGELRIPFMLGC